MQVHSIWIPVSNLSDLHNPLPPRAIGFTKKTIKSQFDNSVSKIESIFARQTLIQFFLAFQEINVSLQGEKIFSLPCDHLKLQEIISWSVWEQFSDAPVTGWMKELSSAISLEKKLSQQVTQSELETANQASTESGASKNLSTLVREVSEQINLDKIKASKQQSSSSSGTTSMQTLNLIKDLIDKAILGINNEDNVPSDDVKTLFDIVDWCITNWYQISSRILQDRAVFDLCKKYEAYVSQIRYG